MALIGILLLVPIDLLAHGEEGREALLDLAVDAVGGVEAVLIGQAGGLAGQEFQGLVHVGDGVDAKVAARHGRAYRLVQHQVLAVGLGDDDALLAREAAGLADVKEALDLFVDATDGLDLAVLVDGAGDGQGLLEGDIADGRKQGAEFRHRGAVTLDQAVGLLEDQAGG